MRRQRIDADQAFFTERLALRPRGGRRSLPRAAALAAHLGIDLDTWRRHPERVVVVVGSKGKGTAATYASAALAAAGLRVGTLTSPGLRSNRERIRVGGQAISLSDYVPLVQNVAATLARVRGSLPDGGYLSPSGLFLLTALRHFTERECAAVVLEAGMGGASDEVSLLSPAAVVITPLFGEHLGVLGTSVAEIAVEKAGVVTAATRRVVVAPQPDPDAAAAIAEALRCHPCRVDWVDEDGERWSASSPVPEASASGPGPPWPAPAAAPGLGKAGSGDPWPAAPDIAAGFGQASSGDPWLTAPALPAGLGSPGSGAPWLAAPVIPAGLGKASAGAPWLAAPVIPAGLGAPSAVAGVLAGLRLLDLRGNSRPDPDRLQAVLRTISLPGRLSHHRRGEQGWVVDCATNPPAIAAALDHCAAGMGPPSAVLTFFPRHRDADPLRTALAGQRVVAVPGGPRRGPPGSGATMDLDALDLESLGPRVLAVGPVYFAGEVLATLDADCEQSFDLSPVAVPRDDDRD